MQENQSLSWQIWIDTGGTFTDCIARTPDGHRKTAKVLSNSSLRGKITSAGSETHTYKIEQEWDAPDDFVKGFCFKLLGDNKSEAKVTAFDSKTSVLTLDRSIQVNEGVSFEVRSDEEAPVLAMRLVTETSVRDTLPPIDLRLATTKATNALLEEKGVPTAFFVTNGFEDLLEISTQQRPDLFALEIKKRCPIYEQVVGVEERLGTDGDIITSLELSPLESRVEQILGEGIKSAAVAFMHSYKNGEHERQLKQWLLEKGFEHVSISSELSPFIRIIPRAETTLVNAYLVPIIQRYLDDVEAVLPEENMHIMTSAGGLTQKQDYLPKDSLLSGPAGGVVGAAAVGKEAAFDKIISLDMGGTSTDVSRYDSDFEYNFEHQVGNAHLIAPTLNIETVAAGGGSICYFDGYKLCVGPQSAGAWPGPACYGAGGPLTITDVNLLLGRLDPRNFHIPVDVEAAKKKLKELQKEVEATGRENPTEQELLSGFLKIANERMADVIRKVSVRKGYDTREYGMVAFGGAGGQHACAIARRLNIDTVLVPKEAGLLSAYGIGNARIEQFAETQLLKSYDQVEDELEQFCESLAQQARQKLKDTGIESDRIVERRQILSMRLEGQETSIEIDYDPESDPKKIFKKAYEEQYGHWISDRAIEVESLRVVASVKTNTQEKKAISKVQGAPKPKFEKPIWFEGEEKATPVYDRNDFKQGHEIDGPALVLDPHSTIVVEPDWRLSVTEQDTLKIDRQKSKEDVDDQVVSEVVKLELFTNRFSSIAEEMGEVLRRTALSVNVKDRLDFSCALLNAEGELVVNAPHIPVHLGALGLCVRKLKEHITMEPGDVVITNHPAYGGSHLPDVTIVTPVFTDDHQLVGYAASRAHHAEIGGTAPGSMPPTATSLAEEGVVIPPMYVIKNGNERWDEIKNHLRNGEYPSRNVEENIADIRAAIAANQRGRNSLRLLCENYGFEEVHHYMAALTNHAEQKMCDTIKNIPSGQYESEEFLDDGTPLKVSLQIKEEDIEIDFSGTGAVHPRNLNATPAIVNSVVMYVLRLLIDEQIPLNEGILKPINMELPTCLLNPDFDEDPSQCPAVVGGNVEVSQRLVDTLLKPFERVACSQGTMNNILFGNDKFGYYETVGGGTGAGPDFEGANAVHHHMTNTRGTDPEVLEHRYPVLLEKYAIRKGSGGKGKHRGGNGIVRKIKFLEPVELTVLTQHRKEVPYGLQGGESGQAGEQYVVRNDGRREQLAATDGKFLEAGDRFILKTPGGGGFGKPPEY
ncbi:hydantoinase B/oxoprolinase family protein [Fodinibius sp. Rm-B-1B1-1]|uniref:hydantoinase B/oxoprolinase family protein n=1 Tax=Fodinibius alkaliphilus TaxID=3140241 RepID=UPI00315A6880